MTLDNLDSTYKTLIKELASLHKEGFDNNDKDMMRRAEDFALIVTYHHGISISNPNLFLASYWE